MASNAADLTMGAGIKRTETSIGPTLSHASWIVSNTGTLARRHAGYDLGTVFAHQFGARHALAPGDALHEDALGLVNQNGHFDLLNTDSY
jgi:hypothetical protein